MIFEGYIGATGVLDERFVGVQGYERALFEKMSHAIVGEATERSITVDAADVVGYIVGSVAENPGAIEYGAVWAPSPMTRGVEFYGGSHDGEIMKRIEPDDGPGGAFPPRSIRVMSEPPTSFEGEPMLPDIKSGVLVEDYERAGIDDTKRRFIYKIKVTK